MALALPLPRVADALTVAVAMQEALASEPWPEGAVVRVRIGVHTGEAEERGGDYFGTAVNRGARLDGRRARWTGGVLAGECRARRRCRLVAEPGGAPVA